MLNRILYKCLVLGIIGLFIGTSTVSGLLVYSIQTLSKNSTALEIEEISGGIGIISVNIRNVGSEDAVNVVWDIAYMQRRFLHGWQGRDTLGTIPLIPANERATVTSCMGNDPLIIRGFSPMWIKVFVYADNATLVTKQIWGMVIILIVYIID
jgi:hypothetical protein